MSTRAQIISRVSFVNLLGSLTLIVSLALFQLRANLPQTSLVGTSPLTWEKLDGCILTSSGPDPLSLSGIAVWGSDENRPVECVSNEFVLLGDSVRIESAQLSNAEVPTDRLLRVVLTIPDLNISLPLETSERTRSPLPQPSTEENYFYRGRDLEQSMRGHRAFLSILGVPGSTDTEWVTFRSQIRFLEQTDSNFALGNDYFPPLLAPVVLALSLAFFVSYSTIGKNLIRQAPVGYYFAFVGLISLGLFLRRDAFFYWDEWNTLQRFQVEGLRGIFFSHNGHFISLFFLWYFLENTVFGEAYVFYLGTSALLHAMNTVLLSVLLSRFSIKILGNGSTRSPIPRILALFYLVSPLHTEVIQWAFEQSVLIAQLLTLLGLYCASNFLKKASRRNLIACAACLFLAPLFHGTGLVASLLVAAFVLVSTRISAAQLSQPNFRPLLLTCIAVFSTNCVVYWLGAAFWNQTSGQIPNSVEAIYRIFGFAFVGTQLGTVMRSLGLFPNLNYDILLFLSPPYNNWWLRPEIVLSALGFTVSALIVFIPWHKSAQSYRMLPPWIFGQVVMFVCLLPAAGARFELGLSQSLALRYQYACLAGFLFCLLPLALWISHESRSRTARRALAGLGFMILVLNLSMNMKFTKFSDAGAQNRLYAVELARWHSELQLTAMNRDARSEELEASVLAAPFVWQQARRDMMEMYGVLEFLSGRGFSLSAGSQEKS